MTGCEKPCKQTGALEGNPPWKGHEELLAPGGVMCGMKDDHATLDYETSTNPFVKVVEHLEGKGFERSEQDISNKDSMRVTLTRGQKGGDLEVLTVRIHDNGQWSRVIYEHTAPKK